MIKRLRASTNVCDCAAIVRAYLVSVGHKSGRIGEREVWVRYGVRNGGSGEHGYGGGLFVAAVGPTRDSVLPNEAA